MILAWKILTVFCLYPCEKINKCNKYYSDENLSHRRRKLESDEVNDAQDNQSEVEEEYESSDTSEQYEDDENLERYVKKL